MLHTNLLLYIRRLQLLSSSFATEKRIRSSNLQIQYTNPTEKKSKLSISELYVDDRSLQILVGRYIAGWNYLRQFQALDSPDFKLPSPALLTRRGEQLFYHHSSFISATLLAYYSRCYIVSEESCLLGIKQLGNDFLEVINVAKDSPNVSLAHHALCTTYRIINSIAVILQISLTHQVQLQSLLRGNSTLVGISFKQNSVKFRLTVVSLRTTLYIFYLRSCRSRGNKLRKKLFISENHLFTCRSPHLQPASSQESAAASDTHILKNNNFRS